MNLDPRVKKVFVYAGYPLLYVFLFCAFAYLTFPYERLKQRIEAGYNASQADKPEPKRMVIGDVTWSWRFPGVVLSDIEILGPKPPEPPPTPKSLSTAKPAEGSEPAEEEKPPERERIYIEEAYAGISPFAALFGDTDVDFSLSGMGGELEGSFEKTDDSIDLEAEFLDVDPGQIPGVAEALEMPITGKLTGTASFHATGGKFAEANGKLDVEIHDLEIGDGKAKVRGLFALPTVHVGTLQIQAEVTEGRVKLEKLEANGQDLDITAEGKARLRDPIATSLIEQVTVAFKFSDKYRDRDDTTRSLLGKPGDKVGGLIDLNPQAKQAKGEDGFYRFRASGILSKPSFRPDTGKAGPGGRGGNVRRPRLKLPGK